MENVSETDVNEYFCGLVPEEIIGWTDCSVAASYAIGVVVIWDSQERPVIIEENDHKARMGIMLTLDTDPASDWPWDKWCELCNYPEDPIGQDDWTSLKDSWNIG